MQKTQRYQETLQNNGGKSRITLKEDKKKKKTKEEHMKFYICTNFYNTHPMQNQKSSFHFILLKFFFNPRSRHNFFSWRHFYGDIFYDDILHGDIPHSNNFHGNNFYFQDTPTNDIKFQTSKYEICFRIPLHISNLTKCSSKPFTHPIHGEKKIL